ncbi:hypothetical protein F7725_000037 [Dissostichus mawsoni]|uniref:Uncharacterized protein n=1 Tax=Dissostichus mawsoni TaxID=36200 RepID=A0A7J5ZJM6_DISMA|nr:hypothetical protein F7725_000037 [Dissostichus mawsoni]
MEKAKAKTKAKRKGGAEKLRARKKQALRADAAACVKITDMFSTGAGPSSAPVADIGGEEDDERERDQREWGEGGELAVASPEEESVSESEESKEQEDIDYFARPEPSIDASDDPMQEMPGTMTFACQTDPVKEKKKPQRSKGVQTKPREKTSKGVQTEPREKTSKGVQTEPQEKTTERKLFQDTGSQCDIIPTPKKEASPLLFSSSSSFPSPSSPSSAGYHPPSSPNLSSSEDDYQKNSEPDMDEPVTPIHKENKFIVFMTCLTKLLTWCHCPDCGSFDISNCHNVFGSLLVITLSCASCYKKVTWNSQPYIGSTPAGNILLSASILLSGATAGKVLRVMRTMALATISSRTYFRHQRTVLLPVVQRSNECGGSYHMEKTGLERSLAHLERQGLAVGTMVTDRHRQIAKWLRETYPHIEHLYDIWHVAKGFSKKLLAASNERECQVLRPWIKSVVNHMYWCAVSTPSGQGAQIVAKWESVVSHVQNVHTGHGDLFPSCIHGRLEGRESHKKWLEPSSKAAVKLETLVCNKTLCKDISKLSGGCQTSSVEGFHSLLIQFAPKMILIAALHYNENANRVQDVTKTGEARFSINYPKGRKGAAVLRRVLESPTYEYAQELLEEIVKECTDKENVDAEFAVEPVIVPPPLCAQFPHPEKADFLFQDTGSQCDIIPTPKKEASPLLFSSSSSFPSPSSPSSAGYHPPSSPNLSSSEDDYQKNSEPDMDEPVTPIHKENKFIVFMTCLTKLLTWCHCPDCGSFDISNCHNVFGSLLVITLSCASCYKKVTWNSQPYIGSTPAGNIVRFNFVVRCHCRKGSAGYENHGIGDNIFTDIFPAPENCFSNECGGSYHMEKTGLERSLAHLERQGLAVGTMVTDRHRQIAKWLRETYPHIEHLYDIWHVAKGFSKKLLAASNERECQVLRPWIKSVVNHMYWCAVSTPSGQGAQIVAKWESVVSHVQNVHTGHGDLFPSCIHGRLEGRESHKKWLEPSSKAAVKLETLVCNKTLCKDISKLSGGCQTSSVEGFHSLLIQFAPKMILIAALHYNENANRVQDVTKTGEARFSINYPKGRKGAAVLRRVLESPTYEYAQELLEEIVKECTDKENVDAEFAVEPVIVPPPLCAQFPHPEKADFLFQDTGSQCDIIPTPKKEASPLLFSSSSSFPSPSSPSSAGYHPPSSPNLSSSEDDYQKNSEPDMDEPVTPIHKENKFIVFMTCLTKLLTWCHCPDCGSFDISNCHNVFGSLLVITLSCASCYKKVTWNSQPYIGSTPAGNILLSASILLSGATAGKVLRVMRTMALATISSRTYFRHQRTVLLPVVQRSNECGGSYHMEKTGLERSLAHLERQGLAVGTMVTDRHRQIAKWLRETYPHIEHLYDIWHVAKGFSKKLLAASNERECQVLRPWIKSVVNHMYWCAVSTPSGQGAQIVAKWESVVSHVQNVHTGHGDLFPSCIHGRLEGRESHKKWLEPSSKAAVKLETLVCNKTLCKDISKLSGGCQTSSVEGFHSLLIQFAPKMILIAALHYNENANRVQDVTKTGEARFSINYPKGRKGAAVLRRVLESPTYELLEEIVKECTDKENVDAEFAVEPVIVPPPLCAQFPHPEKADFKNSEPDMEPVTPTTRRISLLSSCCLTKLLTWCNCPDCVITLSCASCYKKVTWNSQPYIGSTPAGNILLSASILLSGATAGKVLRVMRTMALATISSRTYFRHQRTVLLPVVQRSNECGGSYHMEKTGWHDGHRPTRQIAKWLRETYPHIEHLYDIWHVAKDFNYVFNANICLCLYIFLGFSKKLLAASNERECQVLRPWIKSVVNHMYWCAVSTLLVKEPR